MNSKKGIDTLDSEQGLPTDITRSNATTNIKQNTVEASQELDYKTDYIMRPKNVAQSFSIGLIVRSLGGIYFSEIMHSIESTMRECGYQLIVANGGGAREQEKKALHYLLSHHCDAMILFVDEITDDEIIKLNANNIPAVVMDRAIKTLENQCIGVDLQQGAYLATKYLIDLGHRYIALINAKRHLEMAQDRSRGYRQALNEANLPINQSLMLESGFSYTDCTQKTLQLINSQTPFTAIIFFNDDMAMAGITCLNNAGLSVPDDVSVIGFDNCGVTSFFKPALTTVELKTDNIGQAAANLAITLAQDPHTSLAEQQKEPVNLIIRDSTAKPPTHKTFSRSTYQTLKSVISDNKVKRYIESGLKSMLSDTGMSKECQNDILTWFNILDSSDYDKLKEQTETITKKWRHYLDRDYLREYEQHYWSFFKQFITPILLETNKPKNILVLGCGRGFVCHALANKTLSVTGIDEEDFFTQWQTIQNQEKKCQFLSLQYSKLDSWLKNNNNFDFVFLGDLLHQYLDRDIEKILLSLINNIPAHTKIIITLNTAFIHSQPLLNSTHLGKTNTWNRWSREHANYEETRCHKAQLLLNYIIQRLLYNRKDLPIPLKHKHGEQWRDLFQQLGFSVNRSVYLGFSESNIIPRSLFVLSRPD